MSSNLNGSYQVRVLHLTVTDGHLDTTTTYRFNPNRAPTVNNINSPARHDSTFSQINCNSYASDPDEGSQAQTISWTTGGNPVNIPGFEVAGDVLRPSGATIAPGRYKFECNIEDACGVKAHRDVTIYINRVPTAVANPLGYVEVNGMKRHFAF